MIIKKETDLIRQEDHIDQWEGGRLPRCTHDIDRSVRLLYCIVLYCTEVQVRRSYRLIGIKRNSIPQCLYHLSAEVALLMARLMASRSSLVTT